MPKAKKYETEGDQMTFTNLLSEVRKAFEVEKNAKNMAYAFIVLNGHLQEFRRWQAYEAPADPFRAVLEHLNEEAGGGATR